MSILDRLLGGESNDGNCCDIQIEEVDAGEPDEADGGAPTERADRAED